MGRPDEEGSTAEIILSMIAVAGPPLSATGLLGLACIRSQAARA